MDVLSIVIGTLSFVIAATVVLRSLSDKKKLGELQVRLNELANRAQKELHDRKSSEVRLGKIGENMAPFFRDWPYDPNDFRFLGNPVDGIQFNEDAIVFVEIKTGKARLTSSQKNIKRLVKEGKIQFATFRVGEEGCTLKVEDEDD